MQYFVKIDQCRTHGKKNHVFTLTQIQNLVSAYDAVQYLHRSQKFINGFVCRGFGLYGAII